MSIFANALLFFIITNPIGSSPTILALIKDYDFNRQRLIMVREGLFALIIALFFQYCGEFFLDLLQTKTYTLTITGGLLLILVSLRMLFHSKTEADSSKPKQEPFIVPIASPLLAGPGLMTLIMIKSKLADSNLEITLALLVSFAGVLAVLLAAPYLQRLIGKKGLDAMEQIMGMILALIGTQMLVKGTYLFLETLKG